MIHYTYTYICGNIINNNDERTHFFRKIYLSHFIRKSCERVRDELKTEQTATYWPQVPLFLVALLSHSAGLFNRGSSAGSWFSLPRTATQTPTNWHQLTQTVCGTGLYKCLTTICFLWASQSYRIQPVHGQGYILISSTGCACFLIDGWVEGQYVTLCTNVKLNCFQCNFLNTFKVRIYAKLNCLKQNSSYF